MKSIHKSNTKIIVAVIICAIMLLCSLAILLSGVKNAFAQTDKNAETASYYNLQDVKKYVTTSQTVHSESALEVYGNSTVSESQFRDIVEEGSPKIYLHYTTDRDAALTYTALLQIKTPTQIYSYELSDGYEDEEEALTGINSFIDKYDEAFRQNSFYLLYDDGVAPTALPAETTFSAVADREYTKQFNQYGYLVYHVYILRYVVDSTSILFIVRVHSSFVPGIVAVRNDMSGYESYESQSGYVHMTVEQAYDANEEAFYGRRWGSIPYRKDYWPVNEPAMCTITSSLQQGHTLGYSFKNGFSLDGLCVGTEINEGQNITYTYTKTITQQHPPLSVQISSDDPNTCQWSFDYGEPLGKETYHLYTNYMFEIENRTSDLFIGDFRLKLDYKYTAKKDGKGKTAYQNADLIVRAGTYSGQNRIYNFGYGMI